jgi:hypothetical protein
MPKMKPEELYSNLNQLRGSYCVYPFKLAANMPPIKLKGTKWGDMTITYTDGVAYLIKHAECYWLITDIAMMLPQIAKKHPDWLQMHFWVLEKSEGSNTTLKCVYDTNKAAMKKPGVVKKYDFTDFPFPPFGKFTLYCGVTFSEDEGNIQNILLPSEY